MFERDGEKLGSIQVDPSSSDPRKRAAAAKKAEKAQAEPKSESKQESTPKSEPKDESKSEPEPEKKAPAKKAASSFKSALDKPKKG